MTASEYQQRVEECLNLMETMPRRLRPTLLKIAEAWLQLADEALRREEKFDRNQNAPTSEQMQ
jgi:phytoene/squalene synthetase